MIFGIAGPTGSGKTHIASHIASFLPVEIISVDSANVYRGMDVGTAKPSPDIRNSIPHHLIDIIEPDEKYNVVQFIHDVNQCADQIIQRGHIPLCVGGTMLYYRALIHGIDPLPPADPAVRQKIIEESKQFGWSHLYDQLKRRAPDYAAAIEPNDRQRIQRALEIIQIDPSFLQHDLTNQQSYQAKYPVHMFAMFPQERKLLHQHIENRFYQMLNQGLVDEVKELTEQYDLDLSFPSMRSIGYRQAWQYIHCQLTKQQFIHKAIVASRQLAKRQLTWIRNWPSQMTFYDPFQQQNMIRSLIREIQYYLKASDGH